MKNDSSKVPEDEIGFYGMNSRWLQPLIASILILAVTYLLEFMKASDPQFADLPSFPSWMPMAAAGVGLVMSGVFAIFTDTLAAKLYRWLLMGLMTAAFWIAIIKLAYTLLFS